MIAPKIFADLGEGRWAEEYIGTRPDLRTSPIPRFDLYPNARALKGSIQTSRGCPFECEFCDVIEYLGRKQRHKPVAQVLAEVEKLYPASVEHDDVLRLQVSMDDAIRVDRREGAAEERFLVVGGDDERDHRNPPDIVRTHQMAGSR